MRNQAPSLRLSADTEPWHETGSHATPENFRGDYLADTTLEPVGIVEQHKLALALGHP